MFIPIGTYEDVSRAWMNKLLVVTNILVHMWGYVSLYGLGAVLNSHFYGADLRRLLLWPDEFWHVVFTHMFIHGDWFHLTGNMIFLWTFGGLVELGMQGRSAFRYLLLYLLCGLVAWAAQSVYMLYTIIDEWDLAIPIVGASGAISGVMGYALMRYPATKVKFWTMIFLYTRIVPLWSWVFLLYWAGFQGIAIYGEFMGAESQGVAFWVHGGGFVAGVILAFVPYFKKQPQQTVW